MKPAGFNYAGSAARIPSLISINYGVFCYSLVSLATTESQERKNPTSGLGASCGAFWCSDTHTFSIWHGPCCANVDVIGDFLIEINVTSPTGIQEINRLNNLSLEKDIWDSIEVKISK